MNIWIILTQVFLWVWFFGCIVTYRFGKILLVEGEGVKSAEFVMLCLYSAGLACFYLWPDAGKWVLFSVLCLWFAVQFLCHWRYTIFGATERKLRGYNECFRGTVRLIPESETRLIPDLYHIILHVLILVNCVGQLTYCGTA